MRKLIVGCILGFLLCCDVAAADVGFRDVRFARGRADDGRAAIIAGGRIGPALPADAPISAQQGGVGVFLQSGDLLQPLAVRNDLHAVVDVAGGDVDGDGRDEVLAVGMGRLTVLTQQGGRLTVRQTVDLDGPWTDRVATGDVDGDGRDEVAVTVYSIGDRAEIGRTTVVFYRWRNGGLTAFHRLSFDGHAGDLCLIDFDGSGHAGLLVEVGAGDEGGNVHAFSSATWAEVWQAPVTVDGARALSLDGRAGRLIAGGADGTVRVFDVHAFGVSLLSSQTASGGITGLVWTGGNQTPALWVATHRRGILSLKPGF